MALDSFVNGAEQQLVKVGNLNYVSHALQRLKERKLFPTIIENAVNYGEHYKLKYAVLNTEAATEAYVKKHSANMGGKSELVSLVVLTNSENNVKTAFACNNKELRSFFLNRVL